MTCMKNLATCIIGLALLFATNINAQKNNESVIDQVNKLIAKQKNYLPKINTAIIADSFSTSTSLLKIYFNSKQSFAKGDLPADYVEMLPEILLPITQNTASSQLLLLAKEKATNEWKTLDYFGNQPPRPTYTPPTNIDAYPAKSGLNNSVLSRVFPSTGSPVATGTLSGKTVWLSPGHGWHNTGSGYNTQRGTSNEIVEDFTTAESIDYYLMGYCPNLYFILINYTISKN